MAIHDKDYGKLFGVREYLVDGIMRVDPEILIKETNFVSKLVEHQSFDYIDISMETQNLSFFPSRKLAEDYLDAICKPTH